MSGLGDQTYGSEGVLAAEFQATGPQSCMSSEHLESVGLCSVLPIVSGSLQLIERCLKSRPE